MLIPTKKAHYVSLIIVFFNHLLSIFDIIFVNILLISHYLIVKQKCQDNLLVQPIEFSLSKFDRLEKIWHFISFILPIGKRVCFSQF